MALITFSSKEINKYKLVPKKAFYAATVTKVGAGRPSKNTDSDAIVWDCEAELKGGEVDGTIVQFWPNDKMQEFAASFYAACQNKTLDEFLKDADGESVDLQDCVECEVGIEVGHRKSDKGNLQNEALGFAPMKILKKDVPFGS